MFVLKDLLSPNPISLAELWDQSVFASVGGGGPFTFSVEEAAVKPRVSDLKSDRPDGECLQLWVQ